MPIKHKKTATAPDQPEVEINKAEWNDDHTNPDIADVNGLQTALDLKLEQADLDSALADKVTEDELATALADKVNQDDLEDAVAALVDSSPAALDTLNELAAALGDDPNFATTVTNAIAAKANTSDMTTALAAKASIAYVDAADVILNAAIVVLQNRATALERVPDPGTYTYMAGF